jgi:hypothetical protein
MRAGLSGSAPGDWFTQEQMLAEASRAGFDANRALIERWVGHGLIDQARTIGGGPKRGVLRGWPENQRQLWLTMLDKRRQTDSPQTLANVPVSIWLIWGEDYVPLRQVRRALETNSEVRSNSPRHDYPRAARKLVRDLARSDAHPRAKDALIDALIHAARDRRFDDEKIAPLVDRVVGPADSSAQADGPRVFGILKAQWAARTHFYEFKDGHFRWARMFLVSAQADYERVRPLLASDPRFGKLHEPYDLDHVANRACRDMLLVLGMAIVAPPGPQMPMPLTLDPWLEGRGHISTTVEVERSPLWLPDGQVRGHLKVEVTVTIDPVA